MAVALLTHALLQQIEQIGRNAPRVPSPDGELTEACGVICPHGCLIELPNVAQTDHAFLATISSPAFTEGPSGSLTNVDPLDPTKAYMISAEDFASTVLTHQGIVATGPKANLEDLLVWHTHPAGHRGPSTGDLRSRIPGLKYLVVALLGSPDALTGHTYDAQRY